MALGSLRRTRWQMKSNLGSELIDYYFELNITWEGRTFSSIWIVKEKGDALRIYLDDDVALYDQSMGGYQGSRYLYISGGNDVESAEALAWFNAKGDQLPLLFQDKIATPSDEVQEITPDAAYQALSKVTVQAVESETLIPENIRKGVVIFGVVGTFEHEPDENLIPANIKKGVEILGVTGTFDGFDPSNPIAQMTNLAGSGQDQFVHDWAQMAKIQLHEQGVSNAYLATDEAQFILAKAVTDLIEDGNLSATTLSLIATLRVNHPHSEDEGGEPNV